MSDKYFPIHTETACSLKWNWNTLMLYAGTTSSCCRVPSSKIPQNFNDFHNHENNIKDRELMLNGQWPERGCDYCRNIEEQGNQSDRTLHLQIPNLTPPELEVNTNATVVTPTIVEVYFSNTCNMSCVYCKSEFSSKIQQENAKFGPFSVGNIILDDSNIKDRNFNSNTEKFWQWMNKNYKTLRRFHVLGGEPFYQDQFDKCLEFLENNSNTNLEFNVVSNLMIDINRLEKIIEKIKLIVAKKKIKRFDLTVSIDCFGDEQEYVRYGLKLNQWRKNFEYIVEQKWIRLQINQVISSLTIKTAPELVEYLNIHRNNRPIYHYLSTPNKTHQCLEPNTFGNYFDKDFKKLLEVMPSDSWDNQNSREHLIGIWNSIKDADPDVQRIRELKILLTEIDRRRNLNWKETFSWIEKDFSYVV